MERRDFLRRAGLAGAGLAGLASLARPAGSQTAPGAPRPNVLFILTDDQPPHTVRRMKRTMARFASGLDLTDTGYCAVPMCGPARVSLLTGHYPHNHGALGNAGPSAYRIYRNRAHERNDMIARMDRAGYNVGFFGKFINGYGEPDDPTNGRFVHPGASAWVALRGTQNEYPYAVNKNGTLDPGIGEQHTTYFGGAAEEFVESRGRLARPWFCYLNLIDPHGPFKPAKAFEDSHNRERYRSPGVAETDLSDKALPPPPPVKDEGFQEAYEGIMEELELVDVWVDRLFATLARTRQLENTVVIFSSDNGFMLGEHGGYHHKSHPYEESARAPFLVRGPGIPQLGPLGDPATDPLVGHLDITATVLEAARAPHDDLDGRPLQGLAGGWRKRLLVEHPSRNWSLVREGGTVYMDLRGESVEMYDLKDDPYQLQNRLHRPTPEAEAKAAELSARLETLKGCGGGSCRVAEDAP